MALMMRREVIGLALPADVAAADSGTPASPSGGGASATTGPDAQWVVMGWLSIVVGAIAAWILYDFVDPSPFTPAQGMTVFAPMYVMAQAIERLLEPFSSMLGSTQATAPDSGTTRTTKSNAVAKLEQATADQNLELAAHWQAVVDRIRRNRTIIAWGIASASAMLLSAWFGFRLLGASGLDAPAEIDVIATGLAVGSGTKPLHDLISNMQKAKDTKANPSESSTTD